CPAECRRAGVAVGIVRAQLQAMAMAAGAGADPGCRRRGTVVPVTAHPVVCRRLGNAACCIRLWRGGDDPRWRAAGLGGGTGLRGETRVGTVPGAAAALGRAGGHRLPFLWCSRRTARGAAAAAT